MPTIDEFINYAAGKVFNNQGNVMNINYVQTSAPYGGQCASLIQGYMKYFGCEVKPRGNAIDWWRNFDSNGLSKYFTKSNTPSNGAVIITNGDVTYGHIGVYYNGLMLQQNYASNPHARLLAVCGTPYGYLIPKFLNTYSDSQLIKEHAKATFINDTKIIIHRDSPTGASYGSFVKGEVQEYTEKWVGLGHRWISWIHTNGVRCFAAISGSEVQGKDLWATFSEIKEEVKPTPTPTEKPIEKVDYTKNVKGYGVDVSEHNKNVDVTKYDFVIIRAAYGEHTDSQFAENVQKCVNANIPFGIYLYDYALNDEQAKAEAYYILDLLKNIEVKLGVWFDMEDADGYKKKNNVLTKERCTKSCEIFCDILKEKGYYTGVYTSSSWIGAYVDTNYPLWIANWGTNDGNIQSDQSDKAVMHQYTSNPLDKNVIYHDVSYFVSNPIKEEVKKDDAKEDSNESTNDKINVNGINQIIELILRIIKKVSKLFK